MGELHRGGRARSGLWTGQSRGAQGQRDHGAYGGDQDHRIARSKGHQVRSAYRDSDEAQEGSMDYTKVNGRLHLGPCLYLFLFPSFNATFFQPKVDAQLRSESTFPAKM